MTAMTAAKEKMWEGVLIKALPQTIREAVLCGLRLALCLLLALSLSTAWAQGDGGIASLTAHPPMSAGVRLSHSAHMGPWATVANAVMSPWVTVLLLVAGCLLLFHDLLTPFTWGVTGTVGVALVGLVFAAHVTQHTNGWVGVLLLLVGLALLLAEIHIVPGHGMAAIGGLLFLFLGMFWSLGGMRNAAFSIPVSSLLTVATLLGFFAYLPKSPVWKQIGREMRQRAALAQGVGEAHVSFIGQRGIVTTGLRPYGIAEINGVPLDVVTEGDFLSVGTPVVVTAVDGDRVIVESVASQVATALQELNSTPLG